MVQGRGVPMGKVVCATHDGAANMKLDSYPSILEVDCCTHTGQLIIVDLYGPKKKTGLEANGAKKKVADMTPLEQVRDPGHNLNVSIRSSPLKRDLQAEVMKSDGVQPLMVYVSPNHRWNYDFLEQHRLNVVYPYISKIAMSDISDKAADRLEFMMLKEAYEVIRYQFTFTVSPISIYSQLLCLQNVRTEMLEVMPVLSAINQWNDFCNKSITEPLLSRFNIARRALNDAALPLKTSTFERVRSIGASFEAAVDKRFGHWAESELFIASEFLDPYVAYKMSKADFLEGKRIVEAMILDPVLANETGDLEDMFSAAGASAPASPKQAQLKAYIEAVRLISTKPPTVPPSSLSYWEQHGAGMQLVLRVYMNLGSIMLCSTPSEAVFNQLALTVTDRRGSLDDNRAASLTLSAVVAKLDREQMTKPSASIAAMADNDLDALMESLAAQSDGVLSAKYVDLVADEFEAVDDDMMS